MKASMPAVNDDMGISEDDDEDDDEAEEEREEEEEEAADEDAVGADETDEDGAEDEDIDEDESDDGEISEEEVDVRKTKSKGKQPQPIDGKSSVPLSIFASVSMRPCPSLNMSLHCQCPDSDSEDFPNFDEEDDDLLSLDEMPDIVLTGSPDPEAENEDEDEVVAGKRKRKEERKERKKKRKEMPVFGSYEDYAAMIEAGGEEED